MSRLRFFLATAVFPPAGLVLLWMRSAKVWAKLMGSVAILILAVAELFLVYGMRMELDGRGKPRFFHFSKRESHYAKLEQSRAIQQTLPAPTPVAVAVAAPAVASAAEPKELAPEPAAKLVPAAYWTDFRGPNRDGVYKQTELLNEWPKGGLKPLWKQPIGGGYASFVIAEGKAFTIEQRRAKEFVTAYDIETG